MSGMVMLLSAGFMLGDAASNSQPTRQGLVACAVFVVSVVWWLL